MSDANLTLEGASRSPSLVPAAPGGMGSGIGGGAGLDAMRARFSGFMGQPAVQKSLPMLGLLVVMALAGAAWLSLREPPQRDLFRGLPDSDKAAIGEVLDKSAIPYNFDKNGALTVSEDDYFKAKMTLASEGLPKSAPDGNSMIDSLPMGASRAVEGEKLRSAREMDLARTIEAIDAVDSARVHLAVEPPSIFLRDRVKPAASVMLRLANGRKLSDQQVQAIVHLVASSVPELSPDAISVVDQNGRLLSDNGGDGTSDKQIEVQARIEERYRQAVVALLTPILGADKFSAEVHAELNFAERQATRETYPQDEARLRVEQGSWQTDKGLNGNGEATGIPGALSDQAPAAATATATPTVQPDGTAAGTATAAAPAIPAMPPFKTAETFNRSFELGREVSVTRDAVGTVKRVSVAVALDTDAKGKPRSKEEIAALEALVKGAVGFDQARGDTVALSSRGFVKETVEEAPWYEASWVSMLTRNLSALGVALVLILGIGRPLMKRRAAAKEEATARAVVQGPVLGKEIATELTRTAQADPARPVTLDMISSTPDYAQRASLIRNFVKQDPDRAALVVRDLLKEGKKDNA
ncbi:flagellar basal-body MS-ring/collar protein FliF [Sphingobium algorifonticola]|uniref:Flagellar M-ring protein n=1 Tax=Sphingobium algorifonticola TaxID=2008318 RepID=A0A437JBR2_9SPHN|nr:flagellar basal-body MS-ring/collar protein FliF [Sphingobium algorifonticola]RVT43339.1 flagellar M-ring protein FliF [Sphingobium algorifonticola]